MKVTITTLLALTVLIFAPAYAQAPYHEAEQATIVLYDQPRRAETVPEWLTDLKDTLWTIATQKGLPKAKILEIEGVIGGNGESGACVNGESGWNPKAVGDNGTSFGLVQIHLPSHPSITREQAEDPVFALNYIVDAFLRGEERQWTCWREQFGVQ